MPRKIAPCGTLTAYNRHKRRGEDACDACLAAKREDQARRDAERRAEQAAAAAEVRESMPPESDRLALLREQSERLRSFLLSDATPASSVGGISKELRAVTVEIEDLERAASKPAPGSPASGSSGPAGGTVGDLQKRRAEREAQREAAAGN